MTHPTIHRLPHGLAFVLLFGLLLFLAACGPGSSPEGRVNKRIDALQQQVDSLAQQHAGIRDSLGRIVKIVQEIQAGKPGKK
ncbi:hypothetical protein V9K67_03955 [Paraflavisolibacter sp. H34]|uniref:hypothetical protein n=1 Tax=Huijunlia imazamoxiresistens TaxID=3127457 RepID=UPI00301884EF